MMDELVLKGIPAAPGIAIGPAYIVDKQDLIIPPRGILENEIPIEIARFEEALIRTREEILSLKKKIAEEMGNEHAQIFDAHLLVLEDRMLIEEVIKRIRQERQSAEYVFSNVLKKYVRIFSNIQDEYLRERTSDVNDIGRRVLKHLMGEARLFELENITEELIVVAHDLSPSNMVSMFNTHILGFATDIGGRTSHTAIMAKSLGIPAVVGLKDATLRVGNQDLLIVDGRMGLLIIHPTEQTLAAYRAERARIESQRHRFDDVKALPAETPDGREVEILANLELAEEIPMALENAAAGVGLYRTEYFYMNRVDLPSEEEQFEAYREVIEQMKPRPVTIRTLDLGGDKFVSSLQIPREMFPYLGWRALRFCLARPDIFRTQLRAVLRASVFGNARLMYPMVAGMDELRQANAILNEVKRELRNEGIRFDEEMPVGVMIEVPAAAVTVDILAKEAAFFSLGTNDLVQYTLVVDRVNEQTASFYEPTHPAVLRMIRMTIEAGHAAGRSVALCGEMSSEPYLALLLLGMGLDEFSMSPLDILPIKQLIRTVRFEDARKVAEKALGLATAREVGDLCRQALRDLAPGLVNHRESERIRSSDDSETSTEAP